MGIDVYAKWDGQTDAERDAQITGFSIVSGHVGYLREAYHGPPYATKVLFPECFDDGYGEGIREEIPEEDILRFEKWWSEKVGSERRVATWDPPREVLERLVEFFGEYAHIEYDSREGYFTWDTGAIPIPAATLRERLPEAIEATMQRYADDPIATQAAASVAAFVELYERLDAEGKNPRVYVSY